jgi:small-conductance mechanosensitive channel
MTPQDGTWLPFPSHLQQTFFFLITLFFARHYTERYIQNHQSHRSTDQRLRTLGNLRNGLSTLLVVGLLYIWAEILSVFALSLFAVALAIVTALKELLMCLHGYILLLRNQFYQLGDRIKIGKAQGDVIDINFLSTTLLEIGQDHQKTGRQISFANSQLLNRTVHNESTFENFAIVTLTIPLHYSRNWQQARSFLLETARLECAPFLDMAVKKIHEGQKKLGVSISSVEPQISFHLPNHEEVILLLRIPCPLQLRETVEQAILSRFMEKMSEKKQEILAP